MLSLAAVSSHAHAVPKYNPHTKRATSTKRHKLPSADTHVKKQRVSQTTVTPMKSSKIGDIVYRPSSDFTGQPRTYSFCLNGIDSDKMGNEQYWKTLQICAFKYDARYNGFIRNGIDPADLIEYRQNAPPIAACFLSAASMQLRSKTH